MREEYNEDIEKAEEVLGESDDFNETPPSDIVAFNELRSCSDLLRMHRKKQLIIKPDFQRDVVWSNPSQTRFIDSLVKQLPVPSMCLSLDYKTEERLMIDGLQRISSIIKFLGEDEWRLSKLDDIDTRISGRTNRYIENEHSKIYDKLENLTVPITILRCDYSKDSHMEYLFTIFHRLNTGGNKLNNQEIRNCIYQGGFNELLKKLTSERTTIALFSISENKTYRFAHEELLLRTFALADKHKSYSGKLAQFLNSYMSKSREFTSEELLTKERKIVETLELLYVKILDGQALPRISKATTEALLVGIYNNLKGLRDESPASLRNRFATLRSDDLFSLDSLKEGLAAKDKVQSRIQRSIEIFS